MLQRLIIRNYALIDNLDISFSEGLNIITGETGAGKSIILGALSLILGQRAESRFFFNQQKKCVIEGTFSVNTFDLGDFFIEHDLDYDTQTVLRREISADGKSRAFINDTPVNLTILKKLGEKLIDIHSQHATLEINDEDFQMLVVDTVAGNSDLRSSYENRLKEYRNVASKLKYLTEERDRSQADLDYIQFQYNELDRANIVEGQQEELEREQKTLTHAEEIKKSLVTAVTLLSDSESSAMQLIKEALSQVRTSEKFNSNIQELSSRLDTTYIELKDIISDIGSIEQNTIVDEERLEEINERLALFYTLQKKHRLSDNNGLIELRENFSAKLKKILFAGDDIAKLEEEKEQLRISLKEIGEALSKSRSTILEKIQIQVESVLHDIGMPNARMSIELQFEEEQFHQRGQDRIQFLFSANKGQAVLPMNKVASGGELSRLMLAIKSLVAVHTSLPTIIFDEIDTGISGEIALRVGTIMENLSKNMQVIAITHLPQIASKGNSHYRVYKDENMDIPQTGIQKLSNEDRVMELAVMLSGHNPGESALQNARELLR